MIDLVIVNPNNRILSPFAGVEPPLWLGLLASYYRDKGESVAIIDAEAMDYSASETAQKVRELKPKWVIVVVMGNNPSVSSTPKMVATKKLVEHLIGEMPIAVTGLHPSALPHQTKAELGVPVLKGKIFEGLPPVAYDLMPMWRYRSHNWQNLDGSPREPYASTYTSLGCPFRCEFCNIHALYGGQHKVWYRRPIQVIAEIDKLANQYGVRNIKFWDELFTLKKEHVTAICDGLIERKLDLNIWAYARVDTVTPETLEKMREAGIKWLAYGFESGNDAVLGEIKKKADRECAVRAVEWTHQAGINVAGNFLFGLPRDNMKSMRETLAFAKSLNIEWGNFYRCEILPGSPLYDRIGKEKRWEKFGQFAPSPLPDKAMRFRDEAFNNFFTDAGYLNNLRSRFGEQAVQQINDMLAFGKPVTREG